MSERKLRKFPYLTDAIASDPHRAVFNRRAVHCDDTARANDHFPAVAAVYDRRKHAGARGTQACRLCGKRACCPLLVVVLPFALSRSGVQLRWAHRLQACVPALIGHEAETCARFQCRSLTAMSSQLKPDGTAPSQIFTVSRQAATKRLHASWHSNGIDSVAAIANRGLFALRVLIHRGVEFLRR